MDFPRRLFMVGAYPTIDASDPCRSFSSGSVDRLAFGSADYLQLSLGRSGWTPRVSCETDLADDISYSLPGFSTGSFSSPYKESRIRKRGCQGGDWVAFPFASPIAVANRLPQGLLSQGLAVAAGGGPAAQLQNYAIETVYFVEWFITKYETVYTLFHYIDPVDKLLTDS